jgi:hypothetical protein
MKNDYNSLAIHVYYPVAAGGKFTVNSLGLSRHCVIHDPQLAEWDIEQTNFDSVYYQRKLEIIQGTVPLPDNLQNWNKFELGVLDKWINSSNRITLTLQKIIDQGRHFCQIGHVMEDFKPWLDISPELKNVIKLTNYTKWLKRCAFKVNGLANDVDNKVVYWDYIDKKEIGEPPMNWLLVDMDDSIFDQAIMQNQIEQLYNHFGFDDFQPELWQQYYQKYIAVHK